MTSIFKPSSVTAQAPVAKILLWGPSGAGKTHFMMGAPALALLDIETRARSFAVRQTEFSFQHAEIPTLVDFANAVREIRSGAIACESVGVDSGSAIYLKLVEEHTRVTEKGAYVTDWVTVNRRFLGALNFIFSVVGRNVIFTMHSGAKLVRQGQDFRNAGEQMVGDERLRFGFDYVLRIEPRGDPAVTPAIFHVEKTSSPYIRVGQQLPGLTWETFRAMSGGTEPPARPPSISVAPAAAIAPAPRSTFTPDNDPPARPITGGVPDVLSQEQTDRIESLAAEQNLPTEVLKGIVRSMTQRRTEFYTQATIAEALHIITALEHRAQRGQQRTA